MPESATPALSRREKSAHRIAMCAQALTAANGFEGFTMDDLAEAAGVSRRTLFNYFDSKLDAVLGPETTLDPEAAEEFRAGGPTGRLLDDLGGLALSVFEQLPRQRVELVTMRQVIRNPRIMAACHERFENLALQVLEMIREREAGRYHETRARVALGTLVMLCDVALHRFIDDDDDRTFAEHYDAALQAAHSLLG